MAVYMAALQPGDTILSLELSHGGHLTHGLKVNFSGRLYTIVHYGVSRDTNLVDYDEVHAQAVDRAVFPGMQGGPLVHTIAAKATCFHIAAAEAFREYQGHVRANADTLAS